jgi:heme/copper-type cytochrome/quinol oxidase subunit 2
MLQGESSPVFPLYHNLDVDNRLVLPTLSNILFLITSADVLHS